MNYEQLKRYNKIFSDEFYLLEHEEKTDFYEFTISGSTRTVYKVSIYKNNKPFCNCPDFCGRAKKTKIVCKHVCFVLKKVLKYNHQNYFENYIMDFDQIKYLYNILEVDIALINLSLTDKYIDLKNNTPDFNKFRPFNDDDECTICYSTFNKKDNILGCPLCLKPIHKKCIEKWLDTIIMGIKKESCPNCRSDIWKCYGDKNIKL